MLPNDDNAKRITAWQKQTRDCLLSEVAFLEKQLIEAGEMSGPTTAELRKLWRDGALVRVE